MLELKPWLSVQGLTVRDFALGLDVPLKTAQDWVYRGVVPLAKWQKKRPLGTSKGLFGA